MVLAVKRWVLLEAGMALPSAEYRDINQQAYSPDEGALGDVYTVMATDNRSPVPIIGTMEVEGCMAAVLVNRSNGRATTVFEHTPNPGIETIVNLKQVLNPDRGEIVDALLIGMVLGLESRANQRIILDILDEIHGDPCMRLRVFDMAFKPHPTSFAIDTRLVPLDPEAPIPVLRAGKMVTTLHEALAEGGSAYKTIMGSWAEYVDDGRLVHGVGFDGRGRF